MVFAIHQHESPTGIPVFPPCWILLPLPSPSCPPGLSQSTGFGCPASCIELALVIYFIYGNVHVSMLFSQIIPPSAHFLIGFFFFLYWAAWAVYKFCTKLGQGLIPCQLHHFANIFSHSVGCFFALSMVSFGVKKFLSLIRYNLFIFVFIFYSRRRLEKDITVVYVKGCSAYDFLLRVL